MAKFEYSDEHSKWVVENKDIHSSYESIVRAFNKEFGTDKSVNAIQQFMAKKLGVYLDTDRKATHYTRLEEEWLVENYEKFDTYEELTEELNRTFGRGRQRSSVREKCTKRLGLKGMKNPTSFSEGHEQTQVPIGTIRKTSNGTTYIKVMDCKGSKMSGYEEPYWLPIQKKVWIDRYGEVPDGKMVIFLDCNKENLDISNLYCIDRKISAVLASNGWYSDNGELTLTAIKWCELFYAMKKEGLK